MFQKLKCLKLCVTNLLLFTLLVVVTQIFLTVHDYSNLQMFLAKPGHHILFGQLANIYLTEFQVTVIFIIGNILWRFIWTNDAILEHTKLLIFWNFLSLIIIIFGLVTVLLFNNNFELLQNITAESLFEGIDFYFSNPEWKILWDTVQYKYQCCGVFGDKDWNGASWMQEEDDNCQSVSDTKTAMLLVPYACCKSSVTSNYQKYVPNFAPLFEHNYNLTDINTIGCLHKFRNLLLELFYILFSFTLIIFILQVVILLLMYLTVKRAKRIFFGTRDLSENSDERPLVIVKYPRNVRCVTLADEENFDEEIEEESVYKTNQKCNTTEAIFLRQETVNSWGDKGSNIFIH